jgi:hypothetical protein
MIICRCKPRRLLNDSCVVHRWLGRNNVGADLILSVKTGGGDRGATRPANSDICILETGRRWAVAGNVLKRSRSGPYHI